jgi:hypothetical protein
MIATGWQNTRENNEDFAITPYLFLVIPQKPNKYKTYGFGLCWGSKAVFVSYSFNVPKETKFFNWIGKVKLSKNK